MTVHKGPGLLHDLAQDSYFYYSDLKAPIGNTYVSFSFPTRMLSGEHAKNIYSLWWNLRIWVQVLNLTKVLAFF
jgi:hypothetical protein